MKSLSETRLIIEGELDGKKYPFLVDTGATVPLIDKRKHKKLGLIKGKEFPGTLVGAGGEIENIYYCNNIFKFGGKDIGQFLLADIDAVKFSIKKETGYEILGIMSLPQMKYLGIKIDTLNNEIVFPNEVKE